MDILVTNNPLAAKQYQSKLKVEFLDTDLIGILTHIRDLIHSGHRLLTHPLSGSVKPNESPYKSVLIASTPKNNNPLPETDFRSVEIIEECITAVRKFPEKNIPEQYLKDLRIVDLSLIRTALE